MKWNVVWLYDMLCYAMMKENQMIIAMRFQCFVMRFHCYMYVMRFISYAMFYAYQCYAMRYAFLNWNEIINDMVSYAMFKYVEWES